MIKAKITTMPKKALYALVAGNMLEHYDATLYGFLAAVLAPYFFPSGGDTHLSIIAGLGTFAAGFIMRPIGGAFFGHIGDRYGRKRAFTLSLMLTALPTGIIGLLPSYDSIGLLAPFTLVACRLLQGLGIGGGKIGALVLMLENTVPNRANTAGSIIAATAFFGSMVGAMIGALFILPGMPAWTWRIPFLLGMIVAYIAYLIRQRVQESIEYKHASEPPLKMPFLDVLLYHKKSFLCTLGLGAACGIPYHLMIVYMNALLIQRHILMPSSAILVTLGILLFLSLLLPLMGVWADKIGSSKLMQLSMLGIVLFGYPYFWIIGQTPSLLFLIFIQLLLALVYSGFLGAVSAFLMRMFPVRSRYSGIAIGYNLGNALFGGTTPLIVTALTHWIDGLAPALYLTVAGLIGWLATRKAVSCKRGAQLNSPFYKKPPSTLRILAHSVSQSEEKSNA